MSIASKFFGMNPILKKKTLKNKFFKFQNYDVKFYEKPFLQNPETQKEIVENLIFLNNSFNYDYGIFSEKDRAFILENSYLMMIFEKDKCVGCFNVFSFFFKDENICYQGIYCSTKKENDFMHILVIKFNAFIYDILHSYKIVSLTNLPYVAYLLYSNFSNVFPHPENMKKNSKKNNEILLTSIKLIEKYFSNEKECFDFIKNRSVVKIENNTVSSKKLVDLPRAPSIEINAMFQFLIEDSRNETILFIGEYNFWTKMRNLLKIIFFSHKIK